jgi:DNA-binding PucR family transcriptional regulator
VVLASGAKQPIRVHPGPGANYGSVMPGGSREDDAIVAKTVAAITSRLYDRLGEVTQSIQQLVVAEISELRGDAQLQRLLHDTVAANIDTFFSSIRHDIAVRNIEPPAAALEYSRRLAQREISANALVRAYRLGHRAALKAVVAEIRAADLQPKLRLDVYEHIEAVSFDYIDRISQQVVATYQDERDHWLENRNSLRAFGVRELLAEVDVDVDAITTAIGYPLRRIHLAVVIWCGESGARDGLPAMERFVHRLAKSAGAKENPLFIAVDRVTSWAWIPLGADAASAAVAHIRACTETVEDAPFIAVGNPLPDIDGFRRSHRQAQQSRAVAIATGAAPRKVTAASDSGLSVAALLGDNVAAASAWVGEVLGPLASPTEGDERLRETLRVFLGAGSSFKAAAEELHLHVNSVKYRIRRAIERRGRPITDDRLDVEVALLLCHWFDAAVLAD